MVQHCIVLILFFLYIFLVFKVKFVGVIPEGYQMTFCTSPLYFGHVNIDLFVLHYMICCYDKNITKILLSLLGYVCVDVKFDNFLLNRHSLLSRHCPQRLLNVKRLD